MAKRHNKGRQNGKAEELKSNSATVAATADDQSKGSPESSDSTEKKQTNDEKWYTVLPQLAADAANVSFSAPVGGKIPEVDIPQMKAYIDADAAGYDMTTNPEVGKYVSNGVATFWLTPTIGEAVTERDPINIAMQSLYAYMRKQMSGRKNYDAPDLAIYFLTGAELVALHGWMSRLVKLAVLYSTQNLYWAGEVIKANGVDPDDLVRHLSDFRAYVNVFATKISIFKLPVVITLLHRKAMIYREVYTEGFGIKDQMYQFAPYSFLRFELYDNTTDPSDPLNGSGMLKEFKWRLNRSDYSEKATDDIIDFAEGMLANITGDEDFSLICGDIMKVFGEGGVIPVEFLDEKSTLTLIHDDFVLSQMLNAKFVDESIIGDSSDRPAGSGLGPFDITQTLQGTLHSWLVYRGYQASSGSDGMMLAIEAAYALSDRLITSETPNPSIGEILEATALVPGASGTTDSAGHFYISTRSEVLRMVRISSFKPYANFIGQTGPIGPENLWPVESEIGAIAGGITKIDITSSELRLAMLPTDGAADKRTRKYRMAMARESFKYLPETQIYYISILSTDSDDKVDKCVLSGIERKWQTGNVARLTQYDVYKIQRSSMISLMYVPLTPSYV